MNKSVNERAEKASSFLDQLNGAIRENPVSAGALGLGILWMFLGNKTLWSLATPLSETARTVSDGVKRASEGASAVTAETASSVSGVALDAVDYITSSVSKPGEHAVPTSAKPDSAHSAIEYGRDIGQSVHKNVAATLDRQPLLLGAIGLGIGLGIASVFPVTSIEQELIGPTAGGVKDRFGEITKEVGQRAEKVFEEAKREASEQRLTSVSAREGVNTLAQKVRATTASVTESIRESSPKTGN